METEVEGAAGHKEVGRIFLHDFAMDLALVLEVEGTEVVLIRDQLRGVDDGGEDVFFAEAGAECAEFRTGATAVAGVTVAA